MRTRLRAFLACGAAVVLLAAFGTTDLAGQSSQFGVRGLGLPGRALSARSFAMGGAYGLFDSESAMNPAALANLGLLTASFTGAQNWRTSENPSGEASAQDNRFPQIFVAGPVGRSQRFGLGLTVGAYTDRSFALASTDTISVGGSPVGVNDTLFSRGGLSDIRLGFGARLHDNLFVGLGLHGITGSVKLESRRTFGDSSFAQSIQRSEVTFGGLGISVGVMARVLPGLTIAGTARTDEKVRLDQDSTRIASTDLPTTLSAGAMWTINRRVTVVGQSTWRSWSVANADIIEQGGLGALNTYEVSGGIEILTSRSRPGHRPLRAGFRYGTLPFPITSGDRPSEFGVSVGTGLRFSRDRGGVDVSLERIRRTQGSAFTENATILTVGVSIRP